MRRPSISTFAPATLAALLSISLVACSSILLVDEGSEFELLVAGGTLAPQLLFISIESGEVTATVHLSERPTSLVVSPTLAEAYIGSGSGILRVNTLDRTVTAISGSPVGRLLAISGEGSNVVVAPESADRFVLYNLTSGVGQEITSGLVREALFAEDGTAYIATAEELIVVPAHGPFRRIHPGGFALALHPSGTVLALSQMSSVALLSICDDSTTATVTGAGGWELAFSPDGSQLFATGALGGFAVSPTSVSGSSCPPAVMATPFTFHNTGILNEPNDILVTPNGDRAYLVAVADLAFGFGLGMYDVPAASFTNLPVADQRGSLSAAVTSDGTALFVGTGALSVLRLNPSSGSVEQTISVPVPPSFLRIARRR